jgi:hypothetical protein
VLLLAAAAGLAVGLWQAWLRLPPDLAPWPAAQLEEPPGWAARLQLNSLAADGPACLAALEGAGFAWSRLPDRASAEGCDLLDVVHVDASASRLKPGFDATCALAAGLSWYVDELQRLAQEHLKNRIARIEHWGTYNCRNVNNAESGRLSQHATANAIDIAAFELADGRKVVVRTDWGDATPAGRFLAAAHDAACGLFNVVLGPDYNALHADHFHLDLGRYRRCR